MFFTDVGYDCYIQTEKIKFVIDCSTNVTKTVSNLIKKSEETGTLINMTNHKSTLSIVVLEDNTVLRSPITAEKIVCRLKINGHKIIEMNSGYFVSVIHIKAIADRESFMAVNLRNGTVKAGNDLQFVRQRERCNSVILMTTGESVCLSKYTKELIDAINTVYLDSPNNDAL